MATTPLCLAGSVCAVGTTWLLCVPPQEAEVPPTVPPTVRSQSQSEQLLLVFNHKRHGDTGPNSAASKAAGSAGGGEHCTDTREAERRSCCQGGKTSHLRCIEEDFQQPLKDWSNFLPVTSLRNWPRVPFRSIS